MASESTTTESSADSSTEEAPDSSRFQAQLGDEYRLRLPAFLVVCVFCTLFLLLNYFPLRGTDLWLHVNFGDWILENGRLPEYDPFMKLSAGMPLVDSAWLSQLIFSQIDRLGGAHAHSALFTACTFLTYVLVAVTIYRRTGSALTVLGLTLLMLAVGWSRLTTIRPENFAFLLFALMLLMTCSREPGQRGPSVLEWVGLPISMLLWANLHGSFLMGLAMIACLAVGHFLSTLGSRRSLTETLAESSVQRWIWLFQLCLLVTLINPYGIDLWLETLMFARRENLRSVLEWQPLVFVGVGGRGYAASIVLLIVILRWSRVRLSPAAVLLLALFGCAPLFGIRMLTWYAPVVAVVLAPHFADCLAQIASAWQGETPANATESDGPAQPPSGVLAWKYSLLSLLAIWIAFSLSPWSHPVLGTKLRPPEQLFDSESTPLALTAYLNENPPSGQVFHPQGWGDWFVRRGPEDMRVFVTSNIHAVPRQVWRDYNRVNRFAPGWQAALDRYNVTTWIASKDITPNAKAVLRTNTDWRLAYEDDQSLVYTRQSAP